MLNNPSDIKEQQTSDVAILSLRKDGIITFEPKKGQTEHNVETMRKEVLIFQEWAKNGKLYFLTDNRTLNRFESDVRIYAQKMLPTFCDKFAIIIQSGISSFLTNIFIHLNRPEIPVKTFTNKEAAFNWLKSSN